IPAISARTGHSLTDAMRPEMRVGVGWGQTLCAPLPFLGSRSLSGFKVISLLAGVGVARRINPPEFAWRFAQAFQGDGYLIPTPAVVDSVATKQALVERCGLQEIFRLAAYLAAVLGAL